MRDTALCDHLARGWKKNCIGINAGQTRGGTIASVGGPKTVAAGSTRQAGDRFGIRVVHLQCQPWPVTDSPGDGRAVRSLSERSSLSGWSALQAAGTPSTALGDGAARGGVRNRSRPDAGEGCVGPSVATTVGLSGDGEFAVHALHEVRGPVLLGARLHRAHVHVAAGLQC